MKLYLTSGEYKSATNGSYELVVKWSGTQKEARQDRKQMKDDGAYLVDTEVIDVPTSKEALIIWLNNNGVTPAQPVESSQEEGG
jgi:hypothetical protein